MTEDIAQTEAAAAPTAEADKGKTLDELLSEFNEPEPTPVKTPAKRDDLGRVVNFVERMEAKEVQTEVDAAISGAVSDIVKDDALKGFDPDIIEGFLHVQAYKNPAFKKAFDNRGKNPAAWKKSVDWARGELSKRKANQPDDAITGDIAAAQASVRGMSTTAPERPKHLSNKDAMSMSDMEWKRYKDSLLG